MRMRAINNQHILLLDWYCQSGTIIEWSQIILSLHCLDGWLQSQVINKHPYLIMLFDRYLCST